MLSSDNETRRRIHRKHLAFSTKKKSHKSVSEKGLVVQCAGNTMFGAPHDTWTDVTHEFRTINTSQALVRVELNPFRVVPTLAGFYLVHHQRRDCLYSPSSVSYLTQLRIVPELLQGVDENMYNEFDAIASGVSYDISRNAITALVYCDGIDDAIRIQVKQLSGVTKQYGSIMALNSHAFTSITYVGENPTHGFIGT